MIAAGRIHSTDIGSYRVNPNMAWQYHSRSRTLCEMLLYHVGTECIQTGREIVWLSAILCTDHYHTVLLLHRFTLHTHRSGRGFFRFIYPSVISWTQFETQRGLIVNFRKNLGNSLKRILWVMHIFTRTSNNIKAILCHIMCADIIVGMFFLLLYIGKKPLYRCSLTYNYCVQLLTACLT